MTQDSILERIDALALGGLCQATGQGKHALLSDIRKLIADHAAHPPAAPALVPLSEQEIVACVVEAECLGTVKLSYEAGPYDIDRPSLNATKFTRAITKALAARNGLTVGEKGGA
jgi:hypothetical protein